MSPLVLRCVSALVLAPPILAAAYFGFPYLSLVLALFAAAMAWEWETLVGNKFGVAGIKIVLFCWLVIFLTPEKPHLAVLGVLVGMGGVYWSSAAFNRGRSVVWSAVAVPYIALPCMALILIRQIGGAETLLWLFGVVWATDSLAYFVGRAVGGPLLAPRVSPKKTWAGFVGGLAGALAVGFGAVSWLGLDNAPTVLAASAVLSVVSQIGDLLESAVKRHFDVKDSSHLIPGHGGIFDRVDGLLTAAPMAGVLVWVKQGGLGLW